MIHALPGMGADHRMFPSPWTNLPEFVAHNWPRYAEEKTLSAVALTVCRELKVCDGDILVGASLGGMVACEIAKIRRLETLYLIGSATNRQEINRLLALLHPLADLAPLEWIRFSAGKIPTDLAQMFATLEASFVRAMCRAIFQWEGLDATLVRRVRIHGRRDLVIPPPPNAELLVNGGHLISMTHAQECVEFIKADMGVTRRPTGGPNRQE